MLENKIDELLGVMLKKNPHLNPVVSEDWLENVIKLSTETVDFQDNYRSPEHREQLIERGVMWHINKLDGFTGNDMAALAMEYTGDFYPFGTATDVIKEKICVSAPEQLFGDGERRMIMLPTVKKKFLKEMAEYELKPYDLAYDKIEEFQKAGGIPNLPWLKSRPESIYIDKNNEVWLVSFKVPAEHSTVISAYEDPGLYYKAPLAQDKIFLEQAGVKVHHTAIVPFSTKEMKVYVSEFPVDLEMEKLVVDAGNQYWEYVQRNELPKRPTGKDYSYIREVPPVLQKLIAEHILTKKIESLSEDKAKKLKERILEISKTLGIDWEVLDKKTMLPGVNISHKEARTFNQNLLKDEFRMLGGNPDDDRFYTNRTQTSITVVRSAKSDHAQLVSEIQEIAVRTMQDGLEDALEYMEIDQSLLPAPVDPTLLTPSPVVLDEVGALMEELSNNSKVLLRQSQQSNLHVDEFAF